MKFKLALYFAILIYCSVSGMLSTMIMPSQDRLFRFITVGCDGLMIAMALVALWPQRRFYGTWSLLVFLLASVLTFLYTSDRFGIVEHLNGLREPMFFFASLIVVYDLYHSAYGEEMLEKLTRFLVVFALVQIPVTIVQFIEFGAGDGVGGTYGTGGGSGYITQLLFIICFFFAVRFASLQDGTSFSLKRLPFLLPVLLPCAINETKISFVLLGLFVVLVSTSRRRMIRTVPLLALGVGLAFMLNHFYSSTVEDTSRLLDRDFIERYLVTNEAMEGGDMPRFQRVTYLVRMMGDDIGSYLLGIGYGVIGGGNVVGVSRLGRSLYYLVTGSRILLFRTWIQGGLIGVLTVAFTMFYWMRSRIPQYPTLRKFYWFLAISLFLIWFYNEVIFDRTFAMIVCFMMIWTSEGGFTGNPEEEQESEAEETSADAEG